METYVAKGIVLKETDTGESNKMLTVFTDTDGKMYLSARGAKKSTSKCFAGAQMFCYSEMNIFKGNGFNRLNNASPIESFYGLRTDLDVLNGAVEISGLTLKVIQEEQPDPETMRLLLNTFYFMEKRKLHPELLTAIYKIRLLCIQGFYPEEDALRRSMGKIQDEAMEENLMAAAMHICESEDERLFSFDVSERVRKKLNEAADKLVNLYIN